MNLDSEGRYLPRSSSYEVLILGGLIRIEDKHLLNYENRIVNLPDPEALLREQNRIQGQERIFRSLARFGLVWGVSLLVVGAIASSSSSEIMKHVPTSVLVGGTTVLEMLGLAAYRAWWLTGVKLAILRNRLYGPAISTP